MTTHAALDASHSSDLKSERSARQHGRLHNPAMARPMRSRNAKGPLDPAGLVNSIASRRETFPGGFSGGAEPASRPKPRCDWWAAQGSNL